MRLGSLRMAWVLPAGLALLCLAAQPASQAAPPPPPNPQLFFVGTEFYETGGKSYTRYVFGVQNSAEYPSEMFAASPNLPPCGTNKSASRTWVDLFDQSGKRLNGFCAFGKPADLDKLWFALERDAVPPSWVYVELTDRATNARYKSNLAETTQ